MLRVVEEANRENNLHKDMNKIESQLHRDLSDLLLDCCSGLESVQDTEFDVDRELEELEKEIALAKRVKPRGMPSGARKKATSKTKTIKRMATRKSSPKPEARDLHNNESDDSSFELGRRGCKQKDVRASPSNSKGSHSSSWTDDLIDSNVDFFIGSCSSRQVDVSTTYEI